MSQSQKWLNRYNRTVFQRTPGERSEGLMFWDGKTPPSPPPRRNNNSAPPYLAYRFACCDNTFQHHFPFVVVHCLLCCLLGASLSPESNLLKVAYKRSPAQAPASKMLDINDFSMHTTIFHLYMRLSLFTSPWRLGTSNRSLAKPRCS